MNLNLEPNNHVQNIIHSTKQDQITFTFLMHSNHPEVMRYFEKMKQTHKCVQYNTMHEFCLLPLHMWYEIGCESEAFDLTPDKSSSGAASECITEPTAGAKSIFIWVQLMSLQLLTKVPPLRHQICFFPLLYLHVEISVFECHWRGVRGCACVCLWGERWIDFLKMASGRNRSHDCPQLCAEK